MEKLLQYWWVAVIAVVVIFAAIIIWRRRNQIQTTGLAFAVGMARASRVVWTWSRAHRFWAGFITVHVLVIAMSVLYELRIIR